MNYKAILLIVTLKASTTMVLGADYSRVTPFGDSMTLSCHPDGMVPNYSSLPAVQWYYDNMALSYNEDMYEDIPDFLRTGFTLIDRYTVDLNIDTVEKNGTYTCRILPPKVRLTTTHAVLVFKPLKFAKSQPRENYAHYLGDRVELSCGVSGWPEPEISWSRTDGKGLPGVGEPILKGSRLEFDATKQSAAVYVCTAQNDFETMAQSAGVAVNYAPELVRHSPSTVYTSLKANQSLFCIGEGGPRPNVSWSFDNKNAGKWNGFDSIFTNVVNDSTIKSTIFLDKITASRLGTYTCTVQNSMGAITKTITITAKPGPIEAPEKVPCKYVDACIVRWDAKLGKIDGYDIVLTREESSENDTRVDSWENRMPYLADRLDLNSRYKLSITPVNDYGRGEEAIITIITPKGGDKRPFDLHKTLWKKTSGSDKTQARSAGQDVSGTSNANIAFPSSVVSVLLVLLNTLLNSS